MLSDAFIAERRSHLDESHAQTRVDPGPAQTASETIYLTTADNDGNMVSFINSLFDEFGSGIVVPGTGFALHESRRWVHAGAGAAEHRRAGQASVPHAHSGLRHEAGRRCRAPTARARHAVHELRTHGRRDAGAGTRAVPDQLFVFGMDIQEAMDAARFRHTEGMNVSLEAPITDSVRAALTAMGHVVSEGPGSMMGGSQAIIRLDRGYAAGSDPRKDGMAVGY